MSKLSDANNHPRSINYSPIIHTTTSSLNTPLASLDESYVHLLVADDDYRTIKFWHDQYHLY